MYMNIIGVHSATYHKLSIHQVMAPRKTGGNGWP